MQIALTEAGGANDEGFRRPRVGNDALLIEADRMLTAAWRGNTLRARADLQEAMATPDFRDAAFEVLDRETLERYQALPATWQGYARRFLVKDFKPKKLIDLLGGLAGLDVVPELTPYPERAVSKALYEISVRKYGARFAFSWESWINDELDELESLPEALSIAARETESREAASLLSDGNGPNGAFFNSTAIQGSITNLMTGNPALTSTSLQAGIAQITSRRDPEGRPVVVPQLVLVVPPSLEVQARAILNATEIEFQEGADGNGQRRIRGANWMRNVVTLVVDPWLTVIDQGAAAATTWYLVPAPTGGRPALGVAFLRGHEEPQVRVKAHQGQAVGGGDLPPTDGGFEIDDIQYRVRHVLDGGYVDPIGTLVSTGAGS
jgi:hypothetical protein